MILLLTSSLQLFSQLNPSLDFEQWNNKTKLVPHEPMSRFDRQYELTNDPHHGKLALSFINGVYYGESPSVLPRKEDSVKNRINFRPFSFDFWVKHATDSPDVKTVAIIYLMKDTLIGYSKPQLISQDSTYKHYRCAIDYFNTDTPEWFIFEFFTSYSGNYRKASFTTLDELSFTLFDSSKRSITSFEEYTTVNYEMPENFNSSAAWNFNQKIITQSTNSCKGNYSVKLSKFKPNTGYDYDMVSDFMPLFNKPDSFSVCIGFDNKNLANVPDQCWFEIVILDSEKNQIGGANFKYITNSNINSSPIQEFKERVSYQSNNIPMYFAFKIIVGDHSNSNETNYYFDHFKLNNQFGLSIPEMAHVKQLAVFPNPASEEINVPLPSSEMGKYFIYNLEGKILKEGIIPSTNQEINNLKLPTFEFANGQYLIQTIQGKMNNNYRFIIQK